MEVFSEPPPSCNHRKPTEDPHLLCRRCRPCKFFTRECDCCRAMASDTKTRIERTWHKSDLRQAQRTRGKTRDGRGSSVEAVSSPISGSHCSDSSASKIGLEDCVARMDDFTTDEVSRLRDPASKLAAIEAENATLRGKLAQLQSTPLSPVPPLPPLDLFETPSRNCRFPGFEYEFMANSSLLPPAIGGLIGRPEIIDIDLPTLTTTDGRKTSPTVPVSKNKVLQSPHVLSERHDDVSDGRPGDMSLRRHGDKAERRLGGMATCLISNMTTCLRDDMATYLTADMGSGQHGDLDMQRHGDTSQGRHGDMTDRPRDDAAVEQQPTVAQHGDVVLAQRDAVPKGQRSDTSVRRQADTAVERHAIVPEERHDDRRHGDVVIDARSLQRW